MPGMAVSQYSYFIYTYQNEGPGSIEQNDPAEREEVFYFECIQEDEEEGQEIDGKLCKKESVKCKTFVEVYLLVVEGGKLMEVIMDADD